ncbi:uncharacterized protein PODANS_4_2890 [Podospora anserina S mat+]|uniref:Podospora anserina S mat+ genomic DNA chromosome 4, supercontig 2 n=1 Tax=Podospora anserina (strain S / ATCC MYA-4624 / DSM 980 / FGSC 10383) TaxID=515849 RepID=B2AE54_PODAN|nr:uncharacterized protein PODANS_4_2890 [Podospora anserina S mat+]CAP61720.1 unnamed protein product [Podospora anserina S mat+]CDP28068.1 Putative protein of unknown function [Podospora anserina S mat+]
MATDISPPSPDELRFASEQALAKPPDEQQPVAPATTSNMNSTSSAPSKPPPAAPANHSPAPPQAPPSASFDTSRRQTQSPLHAPGQPRKSQGARKQHRNQRRAGPSFGDSHMDDEDAMAEIRALRNTSSRRGQTSITHLMNYALPPRPYEGSHAPYSRSYRRNPAWGVGSGYHAVDKARYIHANYRFVVTPEGDYTVQASDADQHIEWTDVLQVIASTESQQTSCPICLSEPVAPRMAKCGHIFCLPCLMRFMNTTVGDGTETKQPKWRKCPICEDSIQLSDVRPVRFYAGQESPLPRPGDDVILRLMARNPKSTLALPRESGAEVLESGEDIPWHWAANVLDYARIMRGTGGYMAEQFDREIEELLKQEKEDELLYQEDTEWTQKAVRAINNAKEKMIGLGESQSRTSSSKAPELVVVAPEQKPQDQGFYFYTSPPHLYLSPLDIRILKTKYGSFSSFPSTLLPRVEHISTGHVVDDALRKRAKYLGHLPQGCLISFLECDWTDIVPSEDLATFAEDIERRRKRNRDKAAQEERERIQAERIEAAQVRGARRQLGVLDEDITAVRFGNAGFVDEESPVNMDDFLPLGVTAATSGTSPPNQRNGFGTLGEISTSPSGSRTVWGTRAVAGEPVSAAVPRPRVDDGWLKDDAVLETLGAVDMTFQMEAMGIAEAGGPSGSATGAPGGGGGVGGGGKKKKKQKITLMSTGGKRGL